MQQTTQKQYHFGYSRFSNVPALRLSVIIGLAAAGMIATAQLATGEFKDLGTWLSSVLNVFPWTMTLTWMLIVDRSTLPGAIPGPAASIERTWQAQAVSDAFHATLAAGGLIVVVFGHWLPLMVLWTLIPVLGFIVLTFGISYVIRKHSRKQ